MGTFTVGPNVDLEGPDNKGADIFQSTETTFSTLRTLSNNLTSHAIGASVTIPPGATGPVVVPDISWTDILITGALDYWGDVTSNALGLPDHVIIPYPNPPSFTIPEHETVYDDSLRQLLSNSIVTDLSDGGYGIKNDTELYVFELERDKTNRELELGSRALFSRSGTSGFSKPMGSLFRNSKDLLDKGAWQLSEVDGKIVLNSNENYSKAKKETYISAIELAKVSFDNYSLALKVAATTYKAKMEAFYQEIKASSVLATTTYEGYVTTVNAFSSTMDALYKSYLALASSQEFSYRKYNNEVMAAVEEGKATLDAIIEELKLYVGIGDAKVRAYAAQAAAALSGLDINARTSYSVDNNKTVHRGTADNSVHSDNETNSKNVGVRVNAEAEDASVDWL